MAIDSNIKQSNSQLADPKPKSSNSKVILIVSLVIGGAVLSFIFLFMILVFIGLSKASVSTYKVSDLVPVSNSDITFTRPKQWVDASYVDKLNKDFGLELSNKSAYGDKIVTDKNGQTDVANAFVIFGKSSGDKTDIELTKKPEFKSKFEEVMNQQLNKDKFKSDLCEDITNFGMNFNYDFNGFPVSTAVKFNCQIAQSQRSSYNADSFEARMAMVIAKDGNSYLYMLVATNESWAKNEPVYLQMLEDFKAV
ncbi:hypothetical protein H6800_03250 [Candidatus Nomurabacteria bacterium]|nr:hypothetical protein [Candidatus Nomurabacteria bacterium]